MIRLAYRNLERVPKKAVTNIIPIRITKQSQDKSIVFVTTGTYLKKYTPFAYTNLLMNESSDVGSRLNSHLNTFKLPTNPHWS